MIQILEIELFKAIEAAASAVKLELFNQLLQDGLATVATMQSEVRGTQPVPVNSSKVGVIHSPARLDPSSGQSVEKFEGSYLFGDLIRNSVSVPSSLTMGESAELVLKFSPSRGDHAVPKRYIDSLISPLYSQVSAALLGSSKTFIYAYLYNPAKTDLILSDSNVRFNSANSGEYFRFSNASIVFLKDGVYKITGNFSGDTFSSVAGQVAFNYNSFDQARIVFGNSKNGSMQVLLRLSANDILFWNLSGATITGASVGITVERIGD